jgi:large subunit ribosomal protein L35
MPKMKTRKSIAKRVKITARGKLFRCRPGGAHLKSRKTPKRIRRFRKQCELSPCYSRTVRRMLGI